jgi:hypothetical protein
MTSATEPQWSTSSYGETTDTTPMELSALGEHFAQCNGDGARRVAMHCGAQSVRGFVLARLVSVMAAIAIVTGMVWLVI